MKAQIVVIDLEFSSSQTGDVLALISQLITGQAQAAAERATPVVGEVAAGIESAAQAVAAHQEIAQAIAAPSAPAEATASPEAAPVEAERARPLHRNNLPHQSRPKVELIEIDWRSSLMSNGPLFKLADQIERGQQHWADLQKPLKERLFTHVVRRMLADGWPSISTFDRLRPAWMPTANAFTKLFKKGWPALVEEIRKGAEAPADQATNGHEPRRSL